MSARYKLPTAISRSPDPRRWMRAAGALGLGAFLFAWALAVSPQLHEWVHHDADHEEHECAATLIHHGGLDNTSTPVVVPHPSRLPATPLLEMRTSWVASLFSASRLFGRAPPALV